MSASVNDLKVDFRRDDKARGAFVSALRRYVLEDLAAQMRSDFTNRVAPSRPREDWTAERVHEALRSRDSFRFYSTLRTCSQDLLYQVVRAPIERSQERLQRYAAGLGTTGSLTLDPDLAVPRSVTAIDVHLMPGSYHTQYGDGDMTMGAVYEHRLRLSTFGVFGPNLDDIGQSVARFMRQRYPRWRPRRILDLGCTVGHNTGAWKDVFPSAEVCGIDVSAPCLRYAHARAQAQQRAIHFRQMNAEQLKYPDASFDLVFSSMFLHELPRRSLAIVFREARRVLRPGGLMLHMELPPANQLGAYDSFQLDWDGHYNNEPFYRAFRGTDLAGLLCQTGFAAGTHLQHVVPSWHALGPHAWRRAVAAPESQVDSPQTGRLARGVRWFCFGAWRD
jgi:SAM-dependent methyltransferase